MERMIDNLIGSYDKGTLSRRDLVGALAALSFANSGALAAAAGFESNSINHVNIAVSDVDRSVEFYQRVFRLPVIMRMPGTVQLGIGKGQHVSVQHSDGRKGLDHFAIGIDRFNPESVISDLRARGANPAGIGNLHVIDPDGVDVQLIRNPPA